MRRATADEPAGVDAPATGEPDFEAPTGGTGIEPDLGTVEEQPERKLRTHGEHIQRETKIAIIGRPNVGKSTLLNALTGTDRAIVSPIAGTTRDAVDEIVAREGHDFRFIDTAGIRRKGKTTLMAEKLSVIMSRKHLEAADVALLMIDATEGVTASDATIGGYAHESGRSVIIVVNKWDLVAPPRRELNEDGTRPFDGKQPADKKVFEQQVRDALKYLDYAPLLFVSAAEGKGLEEVFKKVQLVARERRKRISTGNMNRFLEKVDFGRASVPMSKRVRIYYMTQAGSGAAYVCAVYGSRCEAALQLRALSGERDSQVVPVHRQPDLVQGEGAEQEGSVGSADESSSDGEDDVGGSRGVGGVSADGVGAECGSEVVVHALDAGEACAVRSRVGDGCGGRLPRRGIGGGVPALVGE